MVAEIERIAGPFNGPTGGVAWNGSKLLFTAISESRIMAYDPASGDVSQVRRFTNRVNGIAFGPNGEFFGAQEGSRRVIEFLNDGSSRPTQSRINGAFHNFPTDLVVDSQGRIWFADPYNPVRATGPQIFPTLPHASVLRAAREKAYGIFLPWKLTRVTFDTMAPRAVLLSPDERTLYVAEGEAGGERRCELRAYPILESGEVGAYRLLHRFAGTERKAEPGISGLCLDEAGNIVACAGSSTSGPGALIYVFSPGGAVIETIALPETPARCTFGGLDLESLYVTTANGNLLRINHFRKGWRGHARPTRGH
jgi:sugar lactone lactonase YvrE